MTKARARMRAKAKASEKAKKRAANAANPNHGDRPGHFDPGNASIKGPGAHVNRNTFAAAKRGSARSK